MHKNRLEAFSDGVLAIIITIMVLEIKVPHEVSADALIKLGPVFFSYIISFIYVGIYWNNHHHLIQSDEKIDGKVLWANHLLLFSLSLIPFASGWMGENHFENLTVLLYGVILFACALSYLFLTMTLLKQHPTNAKIHQAVGNKKKEYISLAAYISGLGTALWMPYLALGLYTFVAILWMIPDSRIEKVMETRQ